MLFCILAQSTSLDSDIVKYLNKRGVLNLYKELYIIARLRQDFGYDQLRLAVTTTTPKGYKWHDTLSIRTFDTPPASGLYFDREELLRTKMVLAQPGRYLFTFTPLMPQPDDPDEAASQTEEGITGVAAVGIEIR